MTDPPGRWLTCRSRTAFGGLVTLDGALGGGYGIHSVMLSEFAIQVQCLDPIETAYPTKPFVRIVSEGPWHAAGLPGFSFLLASAAGLVRSSSGRLEGCGDVEIQKHWL